MFDAVICFHGFAGSPSDFDFLKEACAEKIPLVPFVAVDLYGDSKLTPDQPMSDWVQKTVEQFSEYDMPLLVGYSMGGRLALNLLFALRDSKASALIISARPGLKNVSEIVERKQFEENWAKTFSEGDLETAFAQWNQLPVFSQSSTSSHSTSLDPVLLSKSLTIRILISLR